MVFWKETNSSGDFLCAGCLIHFPHCTQCKCSVSCKNESRFRSAPGAGGQVLPVTAAPVGILCSGLGPPPTVCPAGHSEGAGVPGPLSLSISTHAGKWVPRKWPVKGTWREQVLVQYFHFALTGGVEMQKMFDPRMRRVFCFGQNNEMRSKCISYKSVL